MNNMNFQKMVKKACAVALASAVAASPALGTIPAFAESTATTNNKTNSDIIDDSKTGSLTIFKYDLTAAEADDEYEAGTYLSNGEKDDTAEEALAKYALAGVQFSYLKVGNIETYSISGDDSQVYVVYEIPTALAEILGLEADDATDMTEDGVSNKCSETGVLHYTSTQIQDALTDALTSDNVGTKNALEEYLHSYATQDSTSDDTTSNGATAMALTDENGMTTASGLAVGLYLIVETEVPENVTSTTDPWFASIPFTDSDGDEWLYDMYCYPKNQSGEATLDKQVRNDTANQVYNEDYDADTDADTYIANRDDYAYADTTTASEGDVLDYILVSKIPTITSESTYLSGYTFADTLSLGLTYNGDVKIALYKSAEDAKINDTSKAAVIWDDQATYYTVSTAAAGTVGAQTGTTVTVALTEAGLNAINPAYSDYYMVVYYTATVNSDASVTLGDDGNANDVTLTYSRTSDEATYFQELEDESFVYSYAINLTKKFSDASESTDSFADVQFVLYNDSDAYYVVANKSADGTYYVTGRTTSEDDATKFTPASDGTFIINGLEADEYELTEIATADGYTLLKDSIVINISSTKRSITASTADVTGTAGDAMVVGSIEAASATVDGVATTMAASGDSANATVVLTVTNNKSFLLPQTGGYGLYMITIIGVIVAAGGIYMVTRKKGAQA